MPRSAFSHANGPVLTLREFEAGEVVLSPEAYAVLRARYAGRIDVAPTEQPGVYRVMSRGYVGRVGLPGGGMLVLRPKAPVANLFYMLCSDAGLAHFTPPPTGLAPNPANHDIARFVALALLQQVARLLQGGLNSGYSPVQESLIPIKGRILMGEQVSRYGELKHRHICSYAVLTVDTPENRVVLAALRLLPAMLDPRDSLEAAAIKRARRQAARFGEVSVVRQGEALALLRSIGLHRLNARYGPVLGLCRLALGRLSFEERAGPHPFASFLVEMPRLFESFLTARLRRLLPDYGLRAVAQRYDYLDEERSVGIRPDLLVYKGRSREPSLALDFKYRRIDEPGADLNTDLYQLSAYMGRYSLRPGVLVYPRFSHTPATRLTLRGTGKQLHLLTVDLAAPTPAALEAECDMLAAQLAGMVVGSEP